MTLELPAPIYPASTYRVALDGADFRLSWRWNDRMASWFLDVFDADEEPIRLGLRVVLDWPLWVRLRGPSRPAGELLAVALDGTDDEPGSADLGQRVRLLYYTAAEVAAAVASDAADDGVIVEAV